MPIYKRYCCKCNHRAEDLENIHAREVIECPSCHCISFTKQPTSAAFDIRGASYRTNYE